MDNSIGVVLIHGAGLGSWIWRETVPHLNNASLAVDFPGREQSTSGDMNSFTLDDYCNHILDSIRAWNKNKIILVAHSIGGVIALKLADQLSEGQVVGFVGISASVPVNGGSFLSTLPVFKRMLMRIIVRLAGTRPPKPAIKKSLCNDLSKEQSEIVADKFVPESRHLFIDKCGASIPDVQKMYIKTNRDQEVPGWLQEKMILNLNAGEVVSLDAGHLPMIGCPARLANTLNQFSADCEAGKK